MKFSSKPDGSPSVVTTVNIEVPLAFTVPVLFGSAEISIRPETWIISPAKAIENAFDKVATGKPIKPVFKSLPLGDKYQSVAHGANSTEQQ